MKQNTLKIEFFTLVELLVVIAILIILASLLQPSLKKVLNHSKLITCSQNLRHSGVAIHLYASDHEDMLSTAYFPGTLKLRPILKLRANLGRFHKGKSGYVEPYLDKNDSLYVCPSIEFANGMDNFLRGSGGFIRGTATYAGLAQSIWTTLVKMQDYKNIGPPELSKTDADKLLLMDPIFDLGNWKRNKGRWDIEGSIIHENTGDIPILMLDGHVRMFDRSAFPAVPNKGAFVKAVVND